MADYYLVRPTKRPNNKTDKKNNQIVGLMWLPDLPLFYRTYPVGPMLLGKTVHIYVKNRSRSLSMPFCLLGAIKQGFLEAFFKGGGLPPPP